MIIRLRDRRIFLYHQDGEVETVEDCSWFDTPVVTRWPRCCGGGGTMRGILDVVLGVVGCFAIFGVFSLIKRLVTGVFAFVTESSRAITPDGNGLNFENEHPMIGRGND